eukprot:gene35365-43607_t
MARLGIPTPPGFIITTESCVEYFDQKDNRSATSQLMQEYLKGVKDLEKHTGKVFGSLNIGSETQPLLLSVRSAAAVVMTGLTDTILNVGINDETVQILARLSKNPRWAYDMYRRFIQNFGVLVLKVDKERYTTILSNARQKNDVTRNTMLTTEDLQQVIEDFKSVARIPQNPSEQLQQVIASMFTSWYSPRAVKYRTVNNIKSEFGCALVVQSMVFGNLNLQSGSGVVFTRDPVSGSSFISGEYLPNADGEEVLAGERKTIPISELRIEMPEVFNSLVVFNSKLEKHYRDMQEIEFTVESGTLYLLESKRGKRTPSAAVQIAVSMVIEHVITEREALLRIDPKQMDYFMHPVVDREQVALLGDVELCRGLPASSGAATGKVILANTTACCDANQSILFIDEFQAEDVTSLKGAGGVVILRSGLHSYAAEVLRSKGKPAVVGLPHLHVDLTQGAICLDDGTVLLREGEVVTVDGSGGVVYRGEMPTKEAGSGAFFSIVLGWADKFKRMHVHADASSLEDVHRACELGAEGVGVYRTEGMFRQEGCADLFRQALLSQSVNERCSFLAKLVTAHQLQFEKIFRAMNHHPVTVRLLDLGLDEFFPSPSSHRDFEGEVQKIAAQFGLDARHCESVIRSLQREDESMGGGGGRRLSVLYPEIVIMQTKAIVGAALQVRTEGVEVRPSVLMPLVSTSQEANYVSSMVHNTWAKGCEDEGHSVNYLQWGIGALVRDPRACLVADRILRSEHVDFLMVSSDELTELTFGAASTDTKELMQSYVCDRHILSKTPSEALDVQAVGSLVHLAVNKGRQAKSQSMAAVCGTHTGDPFSVRFFNKIDVDVLCCVPSRIAVAKVAAAQAHIEHATLYQ